MQYMSMLLRSYLLGACAVALVLAGASIVFYEPLPAKVYASVGASTSVTVGNATPSVSAVAVTPSPIVLNDNATATVTITATITDSNGCGEVISSGSIAFVLYQSGVAATSSCTASTGCYTGYSTYSVQASDSCGASPDTTANVSTTIPVWYNADPTDSSSTYSAQWWVGYVKANDYLDASSSATSSTAVELNTLAGVAVTPSTINHGQVSAGANSGATNQTATTTNTGNSKIDIEFSGTDMTGAGTLTVDNQKYSTTSVTYASLAYTLSTTAALKDINLGATTATTSPTTSSTYWGINIPNGTASGTYTGTNTFTAVWSN